MKLEKIYELWDQDSKIDSTNLHTESLKIPQLHNKYSKIYVSEKLTLLKYEQELKKLIHEKKEFLIFGPTEETEERGWKLPPRGKIIKNEADSFVEADSDVVELSLKIGLQKEKVQFLESIIRTINNRSFQIKNALEWLKFTNGIS